MYASSEEKICGRGQSEAGSEKWRSLYTYTGYFRFRYAVIRDSREYTCKLKEAICGEDGRESKYEYRIASTKFLPGNDRGFYNLFYEAFEYGQAHFLKAVF